MKNPKIDDKVKIYGNVVYAHYGRFQGTYNYCRETIGVIVGIVNELDEILVRVLKDNACLSRSLVGKTVEVHPKQCRKVKV